MGKIQATNMRRKLEKEARKRDTVRLYFDEHKSPKEIAAELHISVSTISTYLKQTREAWAERANVTVSDQINQELVKLDEHEANINRWIAFFRLDTNDPMEASRNANEARKWEELWIKLSARRSALLGLDKAKKYEIDNSQPVVINLLSVDGSKDDREQIIEGQFTDVEDDEDF